MLYRPYKNLYEFRKEFNIGETVSIKHKITDRIYNVIYLGDSFNKKDSDFEVYDVEINFGGSWFSFEELFNNYEYFKWDAHECGNILKPFGVQKC